MEQIVKLTGRIAKAFPVTKGVSNRTGNEWTSQEYLFEYFTWSGATVPDRLVVRVFGEDRIKKINLQELEENVTLTIRFQANEYGDRWFNEIRVVNVERANQPANQPAQGANGQQGGQQATQGNQGAQPAPFQPQVDQNGNPINKEGGDDDLPF